MENFKEQLNKYSKKVLIEYLIRSTDDTKREELLKIISTCKRYMESSQIIAKSDELWCYYEIAFQEKIDYLKELECKYGKEYSLKTLTTDEINKLIEVEAKVKSTWENYRRHERKLERSYNESKN